MRDRNIRRPQARNVSTADVNPLNWRYFIIMLICGCILAAGFFFAARQHFTSMEFGIKNSQLRKQLEDLKSENRRLMHSREVSLSPGEIKRAARNLGFRELESGSFVAAAGTELKNKLSPVAISVKQPVLVAKMPGVIKTAYQKPVTEVPADRQSNNERTAKQDKKPQPSNINKEIATIAKLR